jgi:hypothetical protein
MGELQEGDNARSLASSTLEILRARLSSLKIAEAQRGTSAPELLFLYRPWGGRNVRVFTGLSTGCKRNRSETPRPNGLFLGSIS